MIYVIEYLEWNRNIYVYKAILFVIIYVYNYAKIYNQTVK